MIPMPWLIIGVLVSLFGTYRVGHHYGWLERDNDMKLAIAKKNEESRKTEQKLTEKLNETAIKLEEVNNVVTQKTTALDRANKSGKLRLCPSSSIPAPASATVATSNQERGNQPDRQADEVTDAERATIQAIAEIVAQGDRNTLQLNACIDAYNEVRTLLNSK